MKKYKKTRNSKTLDNNLTLSVSKNAKQGNEISRTKLYEKAHADLHSTLLNGNENITVNGQSHILIEGKMSAFWEWDDEAITESDLDDFSAYINSLDETVQIFRDFDNKKYKVTFEYLGENSYLISSKVEFGPITGLYTSTMELIEINKINVNSHIN